MPLRGTSWAAQRDRSKPSNSTVPRLRGASPMIARNVVVFPTPLRPSKAADSPAFTSRLTPWRICMRCLFDIIVVFWAPEISLAHPLVAGNFFGTAGGEDSPLRHNGDVIG